MGPKDGFRRIARGKFRYFLFTSVAGATLCLGGVHATAQVQAGDTATHALQPAIPPTAASAPSLGESANGDSGKPAWIVQPRITVTETFTDNALSGTTTSGNKSDLISQISPGINVESRAGRFKGHLDYSLNQIYYVQNSQRNQTQNALQAMATLEALDKWMYVDFMGNISQQLSSAFGTQTASNGAINTNRTETSTFGISPYFRGRLLGVADYMVRYNRSTTDTRSTQAFGNDTDTWTATVSADTGLANLGWAADASSTSVDYSNGRHNRADRYNGTLIWTIDPQFRVRGTAGVESNNYVTDQQTSSATHGFGFDWAPTERTSVSAFREHRFFGEGHRLEFHHRTPLTAWSFTDTRDTSVTNQSGNAAVATVQDIFNAVCASAGSQTAIANCVNGLFLLFPGLSGTSPLFSNFLASQASLQRSQQLSFAITGVRNTITFLATRTKTQALQSQTIALFSEEFKLANIINQRAFSINWALKLTGQSSVVATATKTNSSGSSTGLGTTTNLSTAQKAYTVNFSTQLTPKTTASFGLRRSEFESATNPYTENAVTGTLSTHF